ncbi:MAG: hypothetical protein IPK39_21595 [Sulfuritalea sp.]|nr:hypothetical protein [Sulfuritalea sp.]
MNETPTPETDSTAEDALKRRLLNRIAIAAVVVVALLGSLAVFDAIYAPSQPATVKTAALPTRQRNARGDRARQRAARGCSRCRDEAGRVCRRACCRDQAGVRCCGEG